MNVEIEKLLNKAERAVRAAENQLKDGDADLAAARAYYAMFYTAEALLLEKGLRFRKHGGVHAAFGEHYAKTGVLDTKYHRWLLDSFDMRIKCDYGVESEVVQEDVIELIRQSTEFLQTARRFLTHSQ
ncbi:MAG: HEPN domain-containing protein [Deltaproteobacteria bacterium]|nr:HEPN domain-containing protein [Deltaproteobacteria bacterium]